GIHSVSRFVESIVRRDLLDGDRGWRPTLERIPDIVPAPERPRLGRAEASMMAELPREPYILFVGVLQPHKGVNVLLEAYERLRSGDVPLSGGAALSEDVPLPRGASLAADVPPLVLIGTRHDDTPERFPDGVTVLNDAPHSVVMAAWERSLFGVAPSIWPDPLPGVVREPMTVGRPVIATDIGGNPDMVTDGVNGLLVPPGDAAALAEAMRRLVEQPRLRDRLGAAARESVAGYTAPEIAACFEQLYARAAAG
ncbi:MAG: hypothetical protein QOH61_1753, partial [Chloroflexota bacterium]|nr:hypothetical protein [Chloroflexota bacterium]